MKTSYVCMGGILFPLLLTLMVCQVQGDCDASEILKVTQCITEKSGRMAGASNICEAVGVLRACANPCPEMKSAVDTALSAYKDKIGDCGSGAQKISASILGLTTVLLAIGNRAF